MADPVEVPEGLRLDRKAFRAWVEERKGRFERVDGKPVAMAPERAIHNVLKMQVWLALRNAIEAAGLGCVAMGDGFAVEVDDHTDYEPDALVLCGEPPALDDIGTPKPVIVVEVASPSTSRVDQVRKFGDYLRMPSVRHYLLVDSGRRMVIQHTRDAADIQSRLIPSGRIVCDPPGLTITVEEIYDGTAL